MLANNAWDQIFHSLQLEFLYMRVRCWRDPIRIRERDESQYQALPFTIGGNRYSREFVIREN